MAFFKRAGRFLGSLALDALFAWAVWEAVNGNAGAANVVVFALWFFVGLGLMITVADANRVYLERIRQKGRSIPAAVSHGIDAVLILFLVWHGWRFTAIGLLLKTYTEAEIYKNK